MQVTMKIHRLDDLENAITVINLNQRTVGLEDVITGIKLNHRIDECNKNPAVKRGGFYCLNFRHKKSPALSGAFI